MDENFYKIMQKIDEGSFGDIFTVISASDRKIYALKQIAYRRDFTDDRYIMNEIKSLTELNHEHIIKLQEVIVTSKFVNLILEYAEIGNLEIFLSNFHPLCEDLLGKFCRQILYAIEYCHYNNFGHCDLTPSNILVTQDYVIKLADFGLAVKAVDDKGDDIKHDDYLGNASYVAPEILMEIPFNPVLGDLWSTGVVLYYLLTSKLLFDGTTEEILQQMRTIESQKSFIPTTSKNVSEKEICDCIPRLLKWNPVHRIRIDVLLDSLTENPSKDVSSAKVKSESDILSKVHLNESLFRHV